MTDRRLLVSGLILVTVSLLGPVVQGAVTGPGNLWQGFWPGHMFEGGHMRWFGTQSSSSAPIDQAPELVLTATDFAFSPNQLVVERGVPVNLTLVNEGALPHDVAIPELGVRVVAAPGQRATVGIVPEESGSYQFLCTFAGHADLGMTGVMVVTD